MRCNPLSAVLWAMALLWICGPAAAQDSVFDESFEVTRNEWYRGEPVQFRFTQCNATGSTLELECGSACWLVRNLVIKNVESLEVAHRTPSGCAAVCIPQTWEADECRSETLEWTQVTGQFPHPGTGNPVEPGTYYAETVFNEPPLRIGNFQILAASLPIPALGGAAAASIVTLLMLIGWRVLRLQE